MAKIKGQLEDAQLKNVSSDPTNLPNGLIWLNTTTNFFKAYLQSAIRTIVTTDQIQALSNKSISGATSGNIVQTNSSTGYLETSSITGPMLSSSLQCSDISNLSLACSVATNNLTLALKNASGVDASASSIIMVGMRSSTLTSGVFNRRTLAAASSLVVPAGATLGTSNGVAANLWVYLVDNAGTLELAISGMLYGEGQLISTTAISAAATSGTTVYSTTARTSVPFRLIGRLNSTQTTAGQYGVVPTLTMGGDFSTVIYGEAPRYTVSLLTSGTTYTTKAGCKRLIVKMVGGGGGGAGVTPAGGYFSGGNGGDTSFNGIVAKGGTGGNGTTFIGGTGGTGGTGTANLRFSGSAGNPGASAGDLPGGNGGAATFFSGAGAGGYPASAGGAATSYGAGGGGAGGSVTSAVQACPGGGSGEYVEYILDNPGASITYAIGAAGAASSGTRPGGAGTQGAIIVEEYYN